MKPRTEVDFSPLRTVFQVFNLFFKHSNHRLLAMKRNNIALISALSSFLN
ncbi:unnamed protein product, partial [Vitis vinifera]|uniref:Uncharacterized protein n=1 Tax=Vitis vinifera TaxID=29760 RepID=E0CQM2_VITVI